MEIRLEFSPECETTVEKDDKGNVRALVFKPFFTSRKGRSVLAYGKSISDDGKKELERFALGVSAADGAVDKKSYAKIKAAADETPQERAANDKSA